MLTLACFIRCTLDLKKKLQEEHLAQIRNNFLRRRLHQHPNTQNQGDSDIDGKRASMISAWLLHCFILLKTNFLFIATGTVREF